MKKEKMTKLCDCMHCIRKHIKNKRDDKKPSECSSGPDPSAVGKTFPLLGSEVFMHACTPLERIRLLKENDMIDIPLTFP